MLDTDHSYFYSSLGYNHAFSLQNTSTKKVPSAIKILHIESFQNFHIKRKWSIQKKIIPFLNNM